MRRIILMLAIFSLLNVSKAQNPIRLGLNFPFATPELTSIDNYMAKIQGSGAQIYRQLTYADLLWKQIEPQDSAWNFTYPDSIFLNYPQFDYVGNLYCFHVNDSFGYQVPWQACSSPVTCGWDAASDSIQTIEYLDTCVSRYGNVIKFWEIGNESEDGNPPAGFTLIDFVDFFEYNYRWIKSINPNSIVMLPSTFGTYGVDFSPKYDWFRDIFNLGAGNYCDLLGFHDYSSWWALPVHIDSIIAIRNSFGLNGKPLWLTESSVSSIATPISPNYATTDLLRADEQAADVWRRSCLAWGKGVEAFIWHGCWSNSLPSEWAEFGILDDTGKKKKSYHSYKLLSQKLLNFSSAEMISQGTAVDDNNHPQGGNGVWVVGFDDNGNKKYVMWSRNNQSYSVTPLQSTKYRIFHVVPSAISTDGESATFSVDSVIVQAGNQYSFSLTSLPIYVEEVSGVNSIVDNAMESNNVEVFPNPVNAYLMLRNKDNEEHLITIIDELGRTIYENKIEPNTIRKIDSKNWANGIYFYKINNSFRLEKLVVSH